MRDIIPGGSHHDKYKAILHAAMAVEGDPNIDYGFLYQAIVEYIEDLHPGATRLFPADPRARARARQVMAFIRSDLGASNADLMMWSARPRGARWLLHKPVVGYPMSGGGPGDGPGTAGVREPRRPYPPGFPPMQASLDPTLG